MKSFIVTENMYEYSSLFSNCVCIGTGGTKYTFCGLAQYGNFVGISIGYTITASISLA